MRGATALYESSKTYSTYFNPRSSCEERRAPYLPDFSYQYFNPRSSCEERQAVGKLWRCAECISIHAPHARSDMNKIYSDKNVYISIHAPHARSDAIKNPRQNISKFQSTLLMRGATAGGGDPAHGLRISIHAPHARSDNSLVTTTQGKLISIHAPHARSDSPDGARLYIRPSISIHAPHARSDISLIAPPPSHLNFNPRSSCEERQTAASNGRLFFYFNPRSSCEERRAAGS